MQQFMYLKKVAYIQRFTYPDDSASALQTIRMAAALASITGDTTLFVHDTCAPESKIKQHYGIEASPLRIHSMRSHSWPKVLYRNTMARFLTFNSLVALSLLARSVWKCKRCIKIIFVRSRLEILYWGRLKPYLWWLRDWIFVCEIHGLDLPLINGHYDFTSSRAKSYVKAFRNYDFLFTPMDGLAGAIREMIRGEVKPEVIPHGSGVERLAASPVIKLRPKNVLVGYIGTIDLLRGLDCVLSALSFLPDRFQLRIVGRINKGDMENKPAWLSELLDDPNIASKVDLCPPVPYKDVAANIDACDIVIQPAGKNIHAARYAAPLKLYDYMARGKPIVAAGVASHLEILKDKENAMIYKPGDPQDLAMCIMDLVKHPHQAKRIARNAWEQSVDYTYDARTRRILSLVESVTHA